MSRRASALILSLALPLATGLAQGPARPALKRGLPAVAPRPVCAPASGRPSATPEQQRAAKDLAQRARQSAILGDRTSARDQLRQAAAVDPTSPDLAYQLARAQEALAANDAAVVEYCRFLALAPSAPEATEVRERLAGLTRNAPQPTVPERILAPFRTGITAYEAGRYAQAAASFGTAIALQPDWADAYYDRALANAARGERALAIVDFQQYLRLRPEAEDRSAVIARIGALRGGPLSPAAALGWGLVIPGAGQMYTGRRAFGAVTLAASGGILYYALKSGPVTRTFTVNPVDPFGNPLPPYTDTRTENGRPHLAAGLGALGALAGITALEAFVHARRVNAEQRFAADVVPFGEGLALRVTLR